MRRVKCDETKPQCLRCQNYGRQCDGYDLPGQEVTTTEVASSGSVRSILPRGGRRGLQFSIEPSAALFENELEHRYYECFRRDVAGKIRGPFHDSGFWSTLTLQTCQAQPALLRVIVALGALSKALNLRIDSSSGADAGDHYRHALQYYQNALTGMRKIYDLRTALVACLLAFSFESFNDRPDLAVAHIQSGFKLLEQWLRSQPRGTKPLSSPAPDRIENELLRIFVRMDIHVLTMANAEPKVLTQVLKADPRTPTLPMSLPAIFSSVSEARLFSEILASKALVLAHTLLRHQPASTETHPDIDPATLYIPGIWAARVRSAVPAGPLEEYKSYLFETHRWFAAYEPLWKKAVRSNSRDYVAAATLRLAAIVTRLTLLGVIIAEESSWDKFLPDFEEIVRIAQSLSDRPTAAPSSSPSSSSSAAAATAASPSRALYVGTGVVTPLVLVALRCRHRKVRGQAVALLRACRQREGLWDSDVAAEVAEWIVGVEEEGAGVTGEIPEGKRVQLTRIAMDAQARKVHLRCESRGAAVGQERVCRETSLVWRHR